MIRAYVIDPRLKSVSEVSYPKITFVEINKAIGSQTMDMGYVLPTRELVWVDDEGMLKAESTNGDCCFVIGDSPLLFGRALVTGPESQQTGEIVEAFSGVEYIRDAIQWRGRKRLLGFDVQEGMVNHPIFGPVKSVKRNPILQDIPE